jgi:hypothetical protein
VPLFEHSQVSMVFTEGRVLYHEFKAAAAVLTKFIDVVTGTSPSPSTANSTLQVVAPLAMSVTCDALLVRLPHGIVVRTQLLLQPQQQQQDATATAAAVAVAVAWNWSVSMSNMQVLQWHTAQRSGSSHSSDSHSSIASAVRYSIDNAWGCASDEQQEVCSFAAAGSVYRSVMDDLTITLHTDHMHAR